MLVCEDPQSSRFLLELGLERSPVDMTQLIECWCVCNMFV